MKSFTSAIVVLIFIFTLSVNVSGCSCSKDTISFESEFAKVRPCYGPNTMETETQSQCDLAMTKIITHFSEFKSEIVEALKSQNIVDSSIAADICAKSGDKSLVDDLENVASEQVEGDALYQINAIEAIKSLDKENIDVLERVSTKGVFPGSSYALKELLANNPDRGIKVCAGILNNKNFNAMDARFKRKVSDNLEASNNPQAIDLKIKWDKAIRR